MTIFSRAHLGKELGVDALADDDNCEHWLFLPQLLADLIQPCLYLSDFGVSNML